MLNGRSLSARKLILVLLGVVVAVSVGTGAGLMAGAASPLPPLAPTHAIALGEKPLWIAVDPTTGRAYVTNTAGGTVSVIDLTQMTVLTEISVGPSPTIIATDPGLKRAYVSHFDQRTVSIVDLLTDTVIATLPVGGLGLAVDAETHRVYAAGGRDIAVIDGETAEVIDTFAVPHGANVWGLAFDRPTGRLFATDLARPRVLVFDGPTGNLVGEVSTSAPVRFAIALDEVARQLYVATDAPVNAELATIDADQVRTLGVTSAPALPVGIALGPVGQLYVSGPESSGVRELRVPTGTRLVTLATGRSALGVAVHAGQVLVVDRHDEILGIRGRLLVFDPAAAARQ